MIPLDAQPIGTRSGELVINWHLTEACNYVCRYCYSKWHATGTSKELIHDHDASAALVNEIYRQFAPTPRNHARLGMTWQSVRLSLAGGEPLLYGREIVRIAAQAKEIGFDVSVISNGSRLTEALIVQLAPHLSLLGLSWIRRNQRPTARLAVPTGILAFFRWLNCRQSSTTAKH